MEININKVGHVVLNVAEIDTSIQFYRDVLGMELLHLHDRRGGMAFLSFGKQHHDIALFQAADEPSRGTVGLEHIAFQIEGGVEELRGWWRHLEEKGFFDRAMGHGVIQSVYFHDPDGNHLEVYCEAMEPEQGIQYLRDGGALIRQEFNQDTLGEPEWTKVTS